MRHPLEPIIELLGKINEHLFSHLSELSFIKLSIKDDKEREIASEKMLEYNKHMDALESASEFFKTMVE